MPIARPVTKAILPVAGMGTRFLPATKAQPKEMLPVVDKPAIQYIVEEAVESGIRDIIFVTSLGKRALEDHFDRNFELEYRLAQKKMHAELREIAAIGKLANFAFVRQHKPQGDGHALLSALPFLAHDEPVAVLFGDDVIDAITPALKQLIDVYNLYHEPVTAVVPVSKKEIPHLGIVDGTRVKKDLLTVTRFVEKPSLKDAPSNLAHIGREILTPSILDILRRQKPGRGKELRLADAFIAHLKQGGTLYARVLDGQRFDCGNKLAYLKAQIHFGLKRPEFRRDLLAYIKSLT